MIILCIQMNMLLSNKCKVKLQCGKTKLVIHKYSFKNKGHVTVDRQSCFVWQSLDHASGV